MKHSFTIFMCRAMLSPSETAMVFLMGIASKVCATVEALVPEGYEDGTGFHFGAPTFKK
jgi:hypothetical protein